MIAAATSALVAASCILMIRYGLMNMAHSARSPAQLKERAKRQAGIARAKLRLAFKWALLAHGIHDDLPSSGTNGAPNAAAWLQNPWLRESLRASPSAAARWSRNAGPHGLWCEAIVNSCSEQAQKATISKVVGGGF